MIPQHVETNNQTSLIKRRGKHCQPSEPTTSRTFWANGCRWVIIRSSTANWEVVVPSGNRVQDEVESPFVLLHRVSILGDYDFMGAKSQTVGDFVGEKLCTEPRGSRRHGQISLSCDPACPARRSQPFFNKMAERSAFVERDVASVSTELWASSHGVIGEF